VKPGDRLFFDTLEAIGFIQHSGLANEPWLAGFTRREKPAFLFHKERVNISGKFLVR